MKDYLMKNKKLENAIETMCDLAHEYAESGGSNGPEMKEFNESYDIIYEEIEKLEEYKAMYKGLEK